MRLLPRASGARGRADKTGVRDWCNDRTVCNADEPHSGGGMTLNLRERLEEVRPDKHASRQSMLADAVSQSRHALAHEIFNISGSGPGMVWKGSGTGAGTETGRLSTFCRACRCICRRGNVHLDILSMHIVGS